MIVGSGVINSSISLLLGLFYALVIGNSYQLQTQWASGVILKISIVIMGLGLNINDIWKTAQDSFNVTLLTILFGLILGLIIGKLLHVKKDLSFLIAGGTAICGGSAIAALAPTIQAKPQHLLVSITVVFLLNAVGLLIYPEIGKLLQLTQYEFGLWAALAIHDTSSVVGAAAIYGEEALSIATTTKLARALWIIPLVFVAALSFKSNQRTAKFPIFIVFFILASLLTSFTPQLSSITEFAPTVAKRGMAVSLFLIGSGFTKETLKELQFNALWQGITLWLLTSIFALWLVL